MCIMYAQAEWLDRYRHDEVSLDLPIQEWGNLVGFERDGGAVKSGCTRETIAEAVGGST